MAVHCCVMRNSFRLVDQLLVLQADEINLDGVFRIALSDNVHMIPAAANYFILCAAA